MRGLTMIRQEFSSNKHTLDLAPSSALTDSAAVTPFFLVALAEIDYHPLIGVFAEEIPVFRFEFLHALSVARQDPLRQRTLPPQTVYRVRRQTLVDPRDARRV